MDHLQARNELLKELQDKVADTDGVLEVSPERLQEAFGAIYGDHCERPLLCNAAVHWGEMHGFHVTWLPVMHDAEFRDYDKLMERYNPQPQVVCHPRDPDEGKGSN